MSDFTSQQAAAVNGRGNLLVVAGAGTGKTHTLIARCLRLVAEERVSLENILMVTFTEAAAAEMRGRLRQALQQRLVTAPADEHLAGQLALLDTARICTLHGFCLQLVREHFHDLDLDPQFGVLDEQQTRPLQREALDEILERHYQGTDAGALAVQELIRTVGRGADKSIRQLILKIHAYAQSLPGPAAWLAAQRQHFDQVEPVAWREMFRSAVAAWRDEWQPRLEEFRGAAPAVDICRAALAGLPAEVSAAAAATLQAVLQADGRKENWPRGSVGKVRDALAGFFDEAGFLGAFVPADGTDGLAQDWGWVRGQMLALIGLVGEFTAAFAARKRELGGVDFADLEQLALQALALPGVAEVWRARLEHVFVDEYQDINAAQDAILTALSRPGEAGNRFLVGDVKQSIYRFRLANPKIFQAYQRQWSCAGPDGKALSLTENFRSREAILNLVNPLFSALMRTEAGGVAYEPLEFGAARQRGALAADGRPVVSLHLIAKPDEDAAVTGGEDDATVEPPETSSANALPPDLLATEREARLVARKLRELKEREHPVWDKELKDFRPVRWSDMAVLMRSPGGRAEAFAKEFNRAGVPLSAARAGFFDSIEVSDLLNLLKLLDNPLQDVPLAAVLRSPLVALTLTELADIRALDGRDLLWPALGKVKSAECGVRNELREKARGFLEAFSRWRELVRQSSLSQTLETALAETHYEALLLAGERGPERVANVRRLLDLARQFDPYQRQGLYRFLRFVRQQEDEAADLAAAAPPAGEAVQLISIHKSKGLEFPVVVLAGLGTRFNEQDLHAPVLLHETLGLCPKITPPGVEQSYPGISHWLAGRSEKSELRGEELRLLYVALTRARDALILVGTTSRQAGDAAWETNAVPVSVAEITGAKSHLDWLLAWLPRVTRNESWIDERGGSDALLDWKIYDANDEVFADLGGTANSAGARTEPPVLPSADVVAALQTRLAWSYAFPAATVERAKASVSELRRRVADETLDEAVPYFRPAKPKGERPKNKLSAAARGTAHHTFLQNVSLERVGSGQDLRNEAERMRLAGWLTAEDVGALDFAALELFWNSAVGQEIRAIPSDCLHRELPFTARMNAADLHAVGLRLAPEGISGEEFVVVQGVADLVVVLAQEIWLLDFKTDEVAAGDVAAKAKAYEPQLRLYALALARIFGRPVVDRRLWFLAAGQGVKV